MQYLLASPIFWLYLPWYSFWNADNFKWGHTRTVKITQNIPGEKKKKKKVKVTVNELGEEEPSFDVSTIPLRSWEEYEASTTLKRSMSQKSAQFQNMASAAAVYTASEYAASAYAASMATTSRPKSRSEKRTSRGASLSRPQSAMSIGAENFITSPLPFSQPYPMPVLSHPSLARSQSSKSMNTGQPNEMYVVSPEVAMSFGQLQRTTSASTKHTSLLRSQSMNSNFVAPENFALTPDAVMSYNQMRESTMAAIPGYPSSEVIREAVRRIIGSEDLMTLTKRNIRERVSASFKVDLTVKP
ncbi:hypothetical protein HK096_004856, partial [Nowakowskiella sp. JEL0078]